MVNFDFDPYADLDPDVALQMELDELGFGTSFDPFDDQGINIVGSAKEAGISKPGSERLSAGVFEKDGDVFIDISARSGAQIAALTRELRKLRKNSNDLSGLFTRIGKHFFKTNDKYIFNESPGRFQDLSPRYYEEKSKRKNPYPILVDSGALRLSLTKGQPRFGSIFTVKKKSLKIGTLIDYAAYHQAGLGVPQRKPVDILVGDRFKTYLTMVRREIFKNVKAVN